MTKNQVFLMLSALAALCVIIWQRKPIIETVSETMGKLTRSQFVQKFAPLVMMVSKGTGLFPSVFLAQGILESNNGNSSLSKEAKNYFGIKADPSWAGMYVLKPTTEYVNGVPVSTSAKFRAYPSVLDGFQDRVNFLKKNTRYAKAGVFIAVTPEKQAEALQRAGYATDPEYSNLLIKLINQNNLKQFDGSGVNV